MNTTRQRINEIIKDFAENTPFGVKTGWHGFAEYTGENLNFFTEVETHFDLKEQIVTNKVSMRASVCRMGGNPTPEELIAVADEIRRGADLVRCINAFELECTESFEELANR